MEIQTDASIHETVETIISEKVSNHNEGAQVRAVKIVDAQPEKEERSQAKDTVTSPTSDSKTQDQIPSRQMEEPDKGLSAVKKEKALPKIVVVTASASGTEGRRGKEKSVDSEYGGERDEVEPPRLTAEKEKEAKEKRKEEERLARKAERARWRKSEQEFSQLPHASMAVTPSNDSPGPRKSEERGRQAVSLRSPSPPYIHGPASIPPPPPPTKLSVNDEEKDLELALELQARLAKEIEEEDERKALEIGLELHRQWEAEQGKESKEVARGTLVSADHAIANDGPAASSYKPERRKAFQASENKPRIVYSDIS